MHPILLALAIIVAGGTLPLLLHRYFLPAKFLHAALTVAGSIFGLSAILSPGPLEDLSWTWLYYCPLALAFDSLTLFFLVPILIICPLAAIYSVHYFNRPERSLRVAVSLFFTNILLVGMVLLTAADNMVSFALAWEIVSIASYILVMYDYEKKTTRNAGYLYFIFTQTGALFIFASFGVIFGATGSLAFSGAAALPEHLKLVAFALAFIGFGSKAGVFPIHFGYPMPIPRPPAIFRQSCPG